MLKKENNKKINLLKKEFNNITKNNINKLFNNKNEKNNLKENKIICVSGNSGVGKSIITINLANMFKENKNKILIIDFDILNNSLHTMLGIKKYSEKIIKKIKNNNLLKEIKIEELLIKINSSVDLISGINLLFDSKYKISSEKIKKIILTLKEKYDVIIIDTSSESFFDYTQEIMKNSDFNFFITEANLSEIKKAKNLLNIYINKWNIPQKDFYIIFNKYNENSIDISILKHIFSGFSILGKLSFNTQYNLIINKNNIANINTYLKNEYKELFNNKLFNLLCKDKY